MRLEWPAQLELPGDKSLSHRLLMMAALAKGQSRLTGLSQGADVQSTRRVLENLGVRIWDDGPIVCVEGRGFGPWSLNDQVFDCGNSGTTARHLLGLISFGLGQARVEGDSSLSSRPMGRVIEPLTQMGASFLGPQLPLTVRGSKLHSLEWTLTVPSAQVKSTLMLTAANAGVELHLQGRLEGRDHTEKLLPLFGGRVSTDQGLHLPPQSDWAAVQYSVPKDPSALANWVALAILEQREVTFEDILLNPTRLGFLHALQQMGAKIHLEPQEHFPEIRGRVHVTPAALRGTRIQVASSHFIDEAPLLALLATQATGRTEIHDLSELRVKECDRLEATGTILNRLGAKVEIIGDSLLVEGPTTLRGATLPTWNDHRISMLGLVAGSIADVQVEEVSSLKISDPKMSSLVRP